MAETTPDKPGFLSRLFGRKAEPEPQPEARRIRDAPQPEAASRRNPEAMPSPPATGGG